jgi:hypothetical protein
MERYASPQDPVSERLVAGCPVRGRIRMLAPAPLVVPVPPAPPFPKEKKAYPACTSRMKLLCLQTRPCMLVRLRMQLHASCLLMPTSCLLMPALCLLMRMQVGDRYARRDRIYMRLLPTPTSVATGKHFCNIRLNTCETFINIRLQHLCIATTTSR